MAGMAGMAGMPSKMAGMAGMVELATGGLSKVRLEYGVSGDINFSQTSDLSGYFNSVR